MYDCFFGGTIVENFKISPIINYVCNGFILFSRAIFLDYLLLKSSLILNELFLIVLSANHMKLCKYTIP